MKRLVVSFPKSGRTWLRYGLHLAGHTKIPFTHDGFEYNDGTKPALSLDTDQRIEKYSKFDRILYVERDPRDTIVSLFHQVTGRFADFFAYEGDVSSFIRDPYFGIHNLVQFQAMWRGLGTRLPVHIETYEDMSRDYTGTFRRIAAHLEIEVSEDDLATLQERTSFSAMKDVEQERQFDRAWLQPRMGAPKVRKGKVGGYREELSAQDIAYLEDVIEQSKG